ncbi:MAG: HlyD family efflux transporter periplasmic adaptor subunit [Patescibacteria group bacterium]
MQHSHEKYAMMGCMKDKMTQAKDKIKSISNNLWTRKKEKKVWIPTTIIVLILLSQLFGGSASADVFTYKVVPKEFIQKVSLTGKVIAAKNVDMGFEVAGRVNSVNVKVGDVVKKGAILASLSNGDYSAAVQKNVAIRQSEQAKLQDVLTGSKKEDVKLAQDNVASAQSSLAISEQTLLDQIRETFSKADEAVRFNMDAAFNDPRSSNPTFKYLIDQNPTLRDSLTAQRLRVGAILNELNSSASIDKLATTRSQINEIQKFINDVNLAISVVAEKTDSSSQSAVILSQKNDIASARNSFSASVSALNQAEASYKTSVNALTSAQNSLSLVTSSATPQQVAMYKANVDSASASVGSAQAQYSRTIIRAPFDGVVTKVDIKEGEISSPNTPVISMLNDGEYQIETFVSENDIAKLKINQQVKVTLDAYGRDVFFDAVVISVDPAETVKDGVSTYRTKIQFVGKDEKVKSGMTANIEIETDKRADILQIPQVALVLEGGVKKARVLKDISCAETATSTHAVLSPKCEKALDDDSAFALVPLQTGEISSTGDIEVISGIDKDQTVIYSTKAK